MEEQRSLKVLVIDDEPPIRNSLKEFLEDYDYDVIVVGSAELALTKVRDHRFDVGIIDLRLPGISGDTFITEASKIQPDMKYLIHTGSVGYRLSIELMDLGVKQEDVFRKPVENLTRFVDKIQELLKRDSST